MKRFKAFVCKQGQSVQSLVNRFTNKLTAIKLAISLWFEAKYFVLFEWFALKTLLLANKIVRKYIVLKGKDPDWVPPAVVPQTTVEDLWNHKGKKNPQTIFPVRGEWVAKPETHPVLKARANWVPPGKRENLLTVNEVTIGVTENPNAQESLQAALVQVAEDLKKEMGPLYNDSVDQVIEDLNKEAK